MMELGVSFSRY